MRESDKASGKYISVMKKMSMSEKTRSDNPSSSSTKDYRQEPVSFFTGRGMKSLGKKYVQDNCFKAKEKQHHHQIVISDQLVRNSKLYRILKQKIQINQSIFIRQSSHLNETKQKIGKQTSQIRNSNHNSKLALWQLKNQILQLKGILNDQEEQTKRLQTQLQNCQQFQPQEEQAQNQMPEQSQKPFQEEQVDVEREKEEQMNLQKECEEIRQQQVDIRMMMEQLHKKMRINPQNEKYQKEEPSKQDNQKPQKVEQEN